MSFPSFETFCIKIPKAPERVNTAFVRKVNYSSKDKTNVEFNKTLDNIRDVLSNLQFSTNDLSLRQSIQKTSSHQSALPTLRQDGQKAFEILFYQFIRDDKLSEAEILCCGYYSDENSHSKRQKSFYLSEIFRQYMKFEVFCEAERILIQISEKALYQENLIKLANSKVFQKEVADAERLAFLISDLDIRSNLLMDLFSQYLSGNSFLKAENLILQIPSPRFRLKAQLHMYRYFDEKKLHHTAKNYMDKIKFILPQAIESDLK